MGKPRPIRVPADDCAVTVGGATYYPHEGEWVDIFVGFPVGGWKALQTIFGLQAEIDAAKGEPDEAQRITALLEPHFDRLCTYLAERLVDWNWTDNRGRPLPVPDGDPELLKRLEAQELYWLLKAIQGQTPSEEKNASAPSPTISSATE